MDFKDELEQLGRLFILLVICGIIIFLSVIVYK